MRWLILVVSNNLGSWTSPWLPDYPLAVSGLPIQVILRRPIIILWLITYFAYFNLFHHRIQDDATHLPLSRRSISKEFAAWRWVTTGKHQRHDSVWSTITCWSSGASDHLPINDHPIVHICTESTSDAAWRCRVSSCFQRMPNAHDLFGGNSTIMNNKWL